MPKRIWFRPNEGIKVPIDPVNEPSVYFPPEGTWRHLDTYMARRLAEKCGEAFDEEPAPRESATLQAPVEEPSVQESGPAPGAGESPSIGQVAESSLENFRRSSRRARPNSDAPSE